MLLTYTPGRTAAYPRTAIGVDARRHSFNVQWYTFARVPSADGLPNPGCSKEDQDKAVFAAHGDPVTFDNFQSFASGGPHSIAPDEQVYGPKLGSTAMTDDLANENNCSQDLNVAYVCNSIAGYEVLDEAAILRFDIPEGFEFYA